MVINPSSSFFLGKVSYIAGHPISKQALKKKNG
jgi:hypothetical protein